MVVRRIESVYDRASVSYGEIRTYNNVRTDKIRDETTLRHSIIRKLVYVH